MRAHAFPPQRAPHAERDADLYERQCTRSSRWRRFRRGPNLVGGPGMTPPRAVHGFNQTRTENDNGR
jgi:hypothetical protein